MSTALILSSNDKLLRQSSAPGYISARVKIYGILWFLTFPRRALRSLPHSEKKTFFSGLKPWKCKKMTKMIKQMSQIITGQRNMSVWEICLTKRGIWIRFLTLTGRSLCDNSKKILEIIAQNTLTVYTYSRCIIVPAFWNFCESKFGVNATKF